MINCIHPGSATVLYLLHSLNGQIFFSYSFPKLHPIVSSIDTFIYLHCHLLSTLVPDDYSSQYTFCFVSQIKKASVSCKISCFYDVTNLITNILL